jgi:hypothetical protein
MGVLKLRKGLLVTTSATKLHCIQSAIILGETLERFGGQKGHVMNLVGVALRITIHKGVLTLSST